MAQSDGIKKPLLSLQGIGKRYPGVIALEGVTLDIFENETIGLVGENGAGKPTLLDILSGVRPPDSGSLLRSFRSGARTTPAMRVSSGSTRSSR